MRPRPLAHTHPVPAPLPRTPLARGAALRALVAVLVALAAAPAPAQQVGECVALVARRVDLGVPLHRLAGRTSFAGERLAHQAVVRVTGRDEASGWLRVRAGEREGWITPVYAGPVIPCPPDEPGGNGGPVAPIPPAPGSYLVGTWNLEHLKDGRARGFPEFQGADAFPARTDDDYRALAEIISLLGVKILVLQEVNGHGGAGDDDEPASAELDRLVAHLGADRYGYVIGGTGGAQRIAMLYDTRAVGLNWVCETALTNTRVDGAQLFARQPLVGCFTFFHEGVEMNDLVVVGVHLASGQDKTRNHDLAVRAVARMIAQERALSDCVPRDEFDVIICGDFNASRFDEHQELFWGELEGAGHTVLATDGLLYPSTRLAGNPPGSRTSQIDYVVVSAGPHGLLGEEVLETAATVHTGIVGPDPMLFRARISDHLPVTVPVRVIPDTDPVLP